MPSQRWILIPLSPLLEPAEERSTRLLLDLKSRFEIYSTISHICIDYDTVYHITYQSKDSANATIAIGIDPSFEIIVNSKKVLPSPLFSLRVSKLPF
ncbi:hypothetical protein E2542_SST11251 [Spatholobus suberectus]|nr:hypothetical protein E2542_SST11251 [Spatholobus suberectus]